MTLDIPIPQSYWVKPGLLLAGEYPGSYDEVTAERRIVSFLNAGVRTFINLTQPHELVPYDEVLKEQARILDVNTAHHRFSIVDRSIPSVETMWNILNSIDDSIQNGQCVYVHCWGGVGRTGTTVGCYLVRHGMSGEQALGQIAEWWQAVPKRVVYPRSPETDEQVEFILNWKEIPDPVHKSKQNFCEG